MPRLTSVNISLNRLMITGCFLWAAFIFISCDSEDYQVAILEKEIPGIEQFIENNEDVDSVERYENFRKFMQLRLDKSHEFTSQFKLNITELSGEEREEYEAEIRSTEKSNYFIKK